MKPGTEADIGPGGEAEWQRLRRQVELAEGFWLGFVFSPSPLSSGVLRRRTERLLRGQTRRLASLHPEAPPDLLSVLPTLFTPELADAGCTWVEALHLDPSGGAAWPWKEAWLELVSRMNERRDALRRHLHGGLVLVASPEMKPFIRDAASDLWSIRALVVELPPVAEREPRESYRNQEIFSARAEREKSSEAEALTEFTLAESERLLAKSFVDVINKVEVLHSRADALLSAGRTGEAVEAARQARELTLKSTQSEPLLHAMSLQKLAQAERAHGDPAAAEEHLEQAAKVLGNGNSSYRILLMDELSDIAISRGDLDSALTAYKESLALTRQLRATQGDTPEILRALSVCLHNVGDVQQRLGHLPSANVAYEESLVLTRQLRATLGDTPETLRALAISLDKVGTVQQRLGNFSAASTAYEESLAIIRQLRATLGDTPETLRDLSVSLNHLGSIQRRLGNVASANTMYEESLVLRHQLRATLGDTPETLADLSTALDGVGSAQRHLGNFSTASAAYDEALSLRRQLRATLGDTPETLAELCIALDRVGDLQKHLGNLSTASVAYNEALSLRRQLHAALGDTPEVLRGLGISLDRLGYVQMLLGDLTTASASYEETLTLARKLRELMGDIPQTIEDLAASLNNVANIRQVLGDKNGAARAWEEAQVLRSQLKE
ncbi:hypothetical protein CYFUS_007763 [Cystobacter fuscus]|uniref:Tetratricopeptide repeat protein n=1 Tax=Cystobacter fuscus TaxID=43 RepID=A0A250JEG7_9BACT|nr:tetratricopeptide repeat protein [Cystobacter fuscus]ATB42285.1 hypothetical protein CYFUS_007763 [Cystobacter fuscus]